MVRRGALLVPSAIPCSLVDLGELPGSPPSLRKGQVTNNNNNRRISAVVWNASGKDGFGNLLLDPLLQTLVSTTHVLTVTVAKELVDNVAMIGSM